MDELLECAAVGPGLRGVLVFDPAPGALAAIAAGLAERVEAAIGRRVATRWLAGGLDEDALWLVRRPRRAGGALSVEAEPGALAVEGPHIVVIADLVTLELSAARGLVAVVGADVVHLERHSVSRVWTPDAWYVAGCARAEAGRVSPHLLDRFAVRLDGSAAATGAARRALIRRWVEGEWRPGEGAQRVAAPGDAAALGAAPHGRAAPDRFARLRAAAARPPRLGNAAAERVLAYLPAAGSPRRDLALARTAVALARLEGDAPADAGHVDQAAGMIGLALPAEPRDFEAAETPEQPAEHGGSTAAAPLAVPTTAPLHAVAPGEPEPLAPAGLARPPSPAPYPEDEAIAGHEFNPLGEGVARASSRAVPRGTIIGSVPATTAHDLDVLATILAAARWQPYRRAHGATGFQILPTDLRRHRRAPRADHLLVVVLDHTCLAGWEWGDLLFPFFRWAYVERAEVCLVSVGAASARMETRAERLLCRSLLDPRLDAALAAGPGTATPLAHGLQLAVDTLRHKLQHVRGARLVVLTDGRGNVPLELAPDLLPAGPVGARGVEDAVTVARALSALSRVERVMLDPEPDLHRHVLERLATAMGAEVQRRKPEAVAT